MKIKKFLKKYILVIVAALIFACILYFKNNVLITSFEQLLYGVMKFKGSGASTVSYGFVYVIISFAIVFPILLLPLVDFGKKLVINIKNRPWQLYPIRNTKFYGIVLIIIFIIGLLYVFEFFPFVKNTMFSSTELFDEYYVDSSNVEITFPKEKNNLIYIFVESLESSNVSAENGGLFEETIIPNLESLALDNINFSHNDKIGGAHQSYGSNWTAGAMIAHTSGVPLKITIDDFDVNSIRFRNVTSIGDILNDNGYNSYLLIGSDSEFGGRKAYFANHNYLIKDYVSAIEEGKIDSDYYEWWGYEDAKLFAYAKEMLKDISADDEPFNLTILTADTHFTDGYMDDSCESKFDDPYSNSFYCSDNKIGEFIEWIKNQDFYEDTTIVITGDHYTMQNGFYDDKDYDSRGIYNVFINTTVDYEYQSKNRVFTVLDMFPTTLASIGVDIEGDRLGLGTNLFSDEKTIPEIMGMDEFNEELIKYSDYYYNYIRK